MRRITLFSLIIIFLISSCERYDSGSEKFILKLYGDALEDIGYSIDKAPDGYYIGGQFTEVVRSGDNNNYIEKESSVKKMAVLKIDTDGNLIWKKYFGNKAGALGTRIIALADGSAACAGYIIDKETGSRNFYIVKVSSDGTDVTEKILNGAGVSPTGTDNDGDQYAVDIIKTDDGFILLGSTDAGRLQGPTGNEEGKKDILLLRLNNSFDVIGDPVVMGFPGNDDAVAIKKSLDGGYIIAGSTDRSQAGQGLSNILVITTNNAGASTGMRIIGTTEDEYASDIEVEDDGYIIAGTAGSQGTDQSVFVCKIPEDVFDELIFQRTYKIRSANATINSFSIGAISKYRNTSYVLAGSAGSGSSARMLIFVADYMGLPVEDLNIIASADGSQEAFDVYADDDGHIIAVGRNSFEYNSLISFYKFRF